MLRTRGNTHRFVSSIGVLDLAPLPDLLFLGLRAVREASVVVPWLALWFCVRATASSGRVTNRAMSAAVLAAAVSQLASAIAEFSVGRGFAAAIDGAAACTSVAMTFAVLPLAERLREIARMAKLAGDRGVALDAAHRDLDGAVRRQKDLETQIFANVSHELRTPLALILGPTERLLESGELNERQRETLEVVGRNARSLLRHVEDLLNIARRDAGRLVANYSEVDLSDLVRTTTSHFKTFAEDHSIALTVEVPDSLPAQVDTGKLQRALLNLLSNAFKFAAVGGTVRCSLAEVAEGHVRIEVADSGPGVPDRDREAVFQRFCQLDRGTTRRFGGTGLGLSIVKDFIEVMGGTVAIGDAPEGGALLHIDLPRWAPMGTPVSEDEDSAVMVRAMVRETLDRLKEPGDPPPRSSQSHLPLVLVIEDNADMNRFIASTLSPRFRVVSALDGKKGLELAVTERPDLVVSDVMMPGLPGDVVVREIRARPELESVPVLVLTAKADDDLRVRLLREGAQDFLTKPFFAEELRARVQNLVVVKRTREILQHDLTVRSRDLEALAREVGRRRRELQTALDVARVARDHAARASAMKTSFLRLVSHELRTPLTSFNLNLARLERRAMDDASGGAARGAVGGASEILHRMSTSAARLEELIESLLEYARVESKRFPVEPAEFDPAAAVEDVIQEISPQAEEKGIALRLRRVSRLPKLKSDPRLLRVVLQNLLGNAVKFTQTGSVVLTLDYDSRWFRFAVSDSGPGIPTQDRQRIFEPFEQMEPVENKHTRGVGLGLSIVKELVEALGGTIDLVSQVGRGSTFTVALPETPPRAPPS